VRRLAAAALMLCVAGCGGTVGGTPTTGAAPAVDALLPAPPIEAVDRPADAAALMPFDERGRESATVEFCQSLFATAVGAPAAPAPDPGADADGQDCKSTPEQEAEARRQMREYRESLVPVAGTTPRTVAELAVTEKHSIELTAWRTVKGRLCLEASSWNGQAGGSAGPFGACVPHGACTESLCIEELPVSTRDGDHRAVAGVVSSSADRIVLTMRGGEERAYPLTGPTVLDFAERAFMVDLGGDSYRSIDVYDGDRRLGHREKSPAMLAFEDCAHELDAMPAKDETARAQMDDANTRLDACMRAHGAPFGG
jgi:hypothetical protein